MQGVQNPTWPGELASQLLVGVGLINTTIDQL
jgi:hypothetical protein